MIVIILFRRVCAQRHIKRIVHLNCRTNSRRTQFLCTFCPYKTTYKANMERHVRNIHEAGRISRFKCDLCNFLSNYRFCVRRHIKSFHRLNDDSLIREEFV